MPAHLVKLVSSDGLTKVYPCYDERLADVITSHCRPSISVSPLRDDELLQPMPVITRRYRLYNREFNREHRVFINEYREVL